MSVIRRGASVLAAATALTFGLAAPALAHVTVNPGSAEQGGWTKVAFRVPNERDDASTVKLEVSFPVEHPLVFVSVKPLPGWKAEIVEGKLPKPVKTAYGETVTEAVTKIVWTGGKINPGEFQEFEVSMGPLPKDAAQIVFPATQTYSSKEVVKWDEPPKADGSEAERPAPVLKLTPASGEGHGAVSASPSPAVAAGKPEAASPSVVPVAAGSPGSTADTTARVLGGAGLAVGVIGVGIGVMGLRRRGTRPQD
ncbi:YcnI family protein [Nonomuraea sp. NPDC050328]|uniref:YcnI family protein n=1 Tax=Nonomuraea sp. NPDC050328 TaxID=3364361 RepID=UPI003799BC58